MLMKVFSKGQVVIPIEIRKNLGIEPGDLIDVTLDYPHKRIELSPKQSSTSASIAGSLARYKRRRPFPDKHKLGRILQKGLLNES
jgi:AbrB family looped-hinge helix DNA binding protein